MKKQINIFVFLMMVLFFSTACTSISTRNNIVEPTEKNDTLLVYADGRMEFNSRFVNKEDVFIYSNGRGGESAAIKVRVPIHPDFYRDSIIVVRVANQADESVADEQSASLNIGTFN